jgi:hypothetical protein
MIAGLAPAMSFFCYYLRGDLRRLVAWRENLTPQRAAVSSSRAGMVSRCSINLL